MPPVPVTLSSISAHAKVQFPLITEVAVADISTSRVSAWSSADPRANDPNLNIQKLAKISYGARVGIVESGKLEFGIVTRSAG